MLDRKNWRTGSELVLLDVAHQRLRRGGIELGQIVESEHQRLDALGAFAIVLFERGQKPRLGLTIEIVENLGHDFMRVAPARLRQVRHEFGAQRLLDALQNFLLHRFHAQHAVDDVERQIFRQDGEHARRMFRPDLRQHDGDSLRVFVLEIIGEHLLLHVGELLPHVAAGRTADFLHDIADPFRRQILLKKPLRRVISPHDRAGGRHARDEFDQQVLNLFGFDRADGRHLNGDQSQFVVVKHAPDLGAVLLAEREHEHRRALGPPQRALGGSRLRVNVQLIDAETGNHLWAERFDKPLADLFDMQDEIVSRLANALAISLCAASSFFAVDAAMVLMVRPRRFR